jgi:hypothetical protein
MHQDDFAADYQEEEYRDVPKDVAVIRERLPLRFTGAGLLSFSIRQSASRLN